MELIPLKECPDDINNLIVQKLLKKYGDRLLLVGCKGSLATNEFTPLSDLDLMVAVKDGPPNWAEFMYGTTYIDIRIATLEQLLHELRCLNMIWPLKAGSILNMKVYHDKGDSFSAIKNVYEELRNDPIQFEQAVELNSFIAFYSKAFRAYQNNDRTTLYWSAMELANQFAFALALINLAYFTSSGPRNMMQQIKRFKVLPDGWAKAFQLTLSPIPTETLEGAQQMWSILDRLSHRYAFKEFGIQNLADISF